MKIYLIVFVFSFWTGGVKDKVTIAVFDTMEECQIGQKQIPSHKNSICSKGHPDQIIED